MTDLLRVFVYGTLKPGGYYHAQYCADRLITAQEAIVYGLLYDLPAGYPALTAGDRPVYGYLLSFADPAVLQDLDDLEDYRPDRPTVENEYIRQQREVFDLKGRSLGLAWVYLMQPERVEQMGGVLLPDGKWFSQA